MNAEDAALLGSALLRVVAFGSDALDDLADPKQEIE